MNKIAKASIAGAAGVILLMGGAGSLAYWNNSAALGGNSTTVTAGALSVTAGSINWTSSFNSGTPTSTLPAKLVPGDALTMAQLFTVNAVGDNLKFKVDVTAPSFTSGSTPDFTTLFKQGTFLVQTYTTTDGSGTATTVTASADGSYAIASPLTVKSIRVSVPYAWAFSGSPTTDNAGMNGTATIGATKGSVTLTQVAS